MRRLAGACRAGMRARMCGVAGVRGSLARDGGGMLCACAVWEACVACWRVDGGGVVGWACVALVHGGACWKRRRPDLKNLGGQTPYASPCATSDAQCLGRGVAGVRGSLARDGRGMRVRMCGVAGVRSLLARGWRGCGSACVCRVGAWRHMLATAGARSQESRRANAVRLTLRHERRPAPH